jgi:hypothetical protein
MKKTAAPPAFLLEASLWMSVYFPHPQLTEKTAVLLLGAPPWALYRAMTLRSGWCCHPPPRPPLGRQAPAAQHPLGYLQQDSSNACLGSFSKEQTTARVATSRMGRNCQVQCLGNTWPGRTLTHADLYLKGTTVTSCCVTG